MRIRPLTRQDAWRSIPQTLCMRGVGLMTLATCGLLWPEPRIALNPAFAEGALIDDLCAQSVLHPLCGDIFRIKPEDGGPTIYVFKRVL